MIQSSESDLEDDSNEEFSNWQVTGDDENNVSSCMDVVEFNAPKGKRLLGLC